MTEAADGVDGMFGIIPASASDKRAVHVDPDGLLAPACGSPRFDRPGTSAEPQAFFLLATAAQDRLIEERCGS